MIPSLLAYSDVLDLLIEWLATRGRQNVRQPIFRGCIMETYEDINNAHRWNSQLRPGSVFLAARQTGTSASYDHTGGSSERLVTLTGSTFPSWSDNATIRFGTGIEGDIASATVGGTTATLDLMMNPGRDVSATSYVLYQRYAWLPADFESFTGPMAEDSWRFGSPISLTSMLALDRFNESSGEIIHHCVAEVPDVFGRKALYVWPARSDNKTLAFVYKRRSRPLRFTGRDSADRAGTVAISAGSAAVVGTGTAFNSEMIGSLFRLPLDSTQIPTGRFGDAPFVEERSVSAVADADHLTLDSAVAASAGYSGSRYAVTDAIDIPRVAYPAFLAMCRAKLALMLGIGANDREPDRLKREAEQALELAMGTDEPYFTDGGEQFWPGPLEYDKVDLDAS